MKFPFTQLPVVAAPVKVTPLPLLPEMMFRDPAETPPIILPDAPDPIRMPFWSLPRSTLPLALVPMRFPSTTLPEVPSPSIRTPSPLPDITLRFRASTPPMTLPVAPL